VGILDDNTAIVTGGGTGIGLAIAKKLHEEGAFLVLCGRRMEALEEGAREIALSGERVLCVQGDINSEADMQRLVKETMDATGRIDVLVNNAAAMRVNKPPEETTLEEFRLAIDTNITGTFLCSREVGKVMIAQQRGRIINITSMSGSIVNRYVHGGSYEISKAGMNMLTKTMAVEWAQHNIKANAIAPGYYATQPNIEFFAEHKKEAEHITDLVPPKTFGGLDELASPALHLARPDMEDMTGSIVTIDGGYTVW
jgi:gluconate 5-dehydrogenase